MDSVNHIYLIVGHVTNDRLPNGQVRAGGTVCYSAFVARELGWQPVIVTSAASGFRIPASLQDACWHILPSRQTTGIQNIYVNNARRQRIECMGRSIDVDAVTPHLASATLVHLAPVAREVDPQLANAIEPKRLVVTPQGWMRAWNVSGEVRQRPCALDSLNLDCRAVVLSHEDINGDWTVADRLTQRASVVVVTEGSLGCTVLFNGKRTRLATQPVRSLDPTGAGDVFSAAFFVRLWESSDVIESARFANAVAFTFVKHQSLDGLSTEPLREVLKH